MTPLLADVAIWPIYVLGLGMLAAGAATAVGIVWLGVWLVRRSRKAEAVVNDDQ